MKQDLSLLVSVSVCVSASCLPMLLLVLFYQVSEQKVFFVSSVCVDFSYPIVTMDKTKSICFLVR